MPLPPITAPGAILLEQEKTRTLRQRTLSGFGDTAQNRLAASRVTVIGAGGLGSPVILGLLGAGVGQLCVIDDDRVELSNLHRQIIHRIADLGSPKTASATRMAADISPHTVVQEITVRLDATNAKDLLAGADLVLDGSDNASTRMAVAESCERLGIPLIWGVVQEFYAQVTIFWSTPPKGFPPVRLSDLHQAETMADAPSCAEVGVLGTLCLQAGALMASEAIKLITGIGEPLLGRVAIIDALSAEQNTIPLRTAEKMLPDMQKPQIAELSLNQTHVAVADGWTIIDVREPTETVTGTLAGSWVVPLDKLLAAPKALGDGPFVLVCEHGARAYRAALTLQTVGAQVAILAGGLHAWREELDNGVPDANG